MDLWRLTPERNAERAFSGEGAKKYGGRWNRSGIAAVYASSSLALCTLEILVHLDPVLFPSHYLYHITVSDKVPTSELSEDLPNDWRIYPAPEILQDIGSRWLISRVTCALRVPSAVIPTEWNWVLNPLHPDFARLAIAGPQLYEFDPRL